MIYKKIVTLLMATIISLNSISFVYADTETTTETEQTTTDTSSELVAPDIVGEAYVLLDQNTGRVLLSKNENERLYPASLTKLLTALVAVEYIDADELIVIGPEINTVPWDSSIAGHKVGETILFENLLRGLLIPSGNDSATVIAMEVARRVTGNEDISYDEAEKVFADLMNEKAKSLGANDSNFVTPHGYHDENHYTTAHDMSLIAMEALKNDLIREICSESIFTGYGAGDKRTVDMFTQEYTWDNTNLLLGGRLSQSDYIYKDATGVKTGSTSEAGNCLIASATNSDDESLLCVIMKSKNPETWNDAKKLFNYGFDNYSNVVLQDKNAIVKEVLIDKPPLGTENILNLVTSESVSVLLNDNEASQVTTSIVINEENKAKTKEDSQDTTLVAPISRGQSLGSISYSLGDTVLYNGSIVAENDVLKRTISSNLTYFGKVAKEIVFSWLIIPISVFIALVSVFSVRFYNIYKIKKDRRKRSQKYRFRTKY